MLTAEEVDDIAALARLQLPDGLKKRMQGDLTDVLAYIAQLERVDTGAVEPLAQVTGIENALRADGGQRPFPMDAALTGLLVGQAPHRHDRYVKVKSVKQK